MQTMKRFWYWLRFCMNLAATANVILYDRMSKMGGKPANERFHLATKDARETA